MKSIREIRNEFEIRGVSFKLDIVTKKVTISDHQSWNEYDYEVIEENLKDYESSIINIKY